MALTSSADDRTVRKRRRRGGARARHGARDLHRIRRAATGAPRVTQGTDSSTDDVAANLSQHFCTGPHRRYRACDRRFVTAPRHSPGDRNRTAISLRPGGRRTLTGARPSRDRGAPSRLHPREGGGAAGLVGATGGLADHFPPPAPARPTAGAATTHRASASSPRPRRARRAIGRPRGDRPRNRRARRRNSGYTGNRSVRQFTDGIPARRAQVGVPGSPSGRGRTTIAQTSPAPTNEQEIANGAQGCCHPHR